MVLARLVVRSRKPTATTARIDDSERREQDGHERRERERHVVGELEREQSADHREDALREVDDPRRPVDEHEAHPDERERGSGREPDDDELQERRHPGPPPRYALCTSGRSRICAALALEDDPARLEHVRALAEVECEQRVLLDEQDRDVLLVVQPVQELDELLDDDRREAERELVDRERARLGHQRATDRDHLLLAARGSSGGAVAQLVQLRQQGVDALETLARLARGGGGSGASRSTISVRNERPNAPSRRFASTGRLGKTWRPSGTCVSPRRTTWFGVLPVTSSPATRTVPPAGRTTPQTALRSEDLPAPLAPMSATRSPAPSVSETPSSATAGP